MKNKLIKESFKGQLKKYLAIFKAHLSDNLAKSYIKDIYDLDPTKDSDKGEMFAGGLLKLYSDYMLDNDKVENLDVFKGYATKYINYYQNLAFNSYGIKKIKINQFKDLKQLYQYIDSIETKIKEVDDDSRWQELDKVLPMIYKDKKWVVFYVDSHKNGVKLFDKTTGTYEKTTWCVFNDKESWDRYKKANSELFVFYNKQEKRTAKEKLILCAVGAGLTSMGVSANKDRVHAFEINSLLNQSSKYTRTIQKLILNKKDKFIETTNQNDKTKHLSDLLTKYDIAHDITWWLENTDKSYWDKLNDRLIILNEKGKSFIEEKYNSGDIDETDYRDVRENFLIGEMVKKDRYDCFQTMYDLAGKEFIIHVKKHGGSFVGLESTLTKHVFDKKDEFNNIKLIAKFNYDIYKGSGKEEKYKEEYNKIKDLNEFLEIDEKDEKEFFKKLEQIPYDNFYGEFNIVKDEYIEDFRKLVKSYTHYSKNVYAKKDAAKYGSLKYLEDKTTIMYYKHEELQYIEMMLGSDISQDYYPEMFPRNFNHFTIYANNDSIHLLRYLLVKDGYINLSQGNMKKLNSELANDLLTKKTNWEGEEVEKSYNKEMLDKVLEYTKLNLKDFKLDRHGDLDLTKWTKKIEKEVERMFEKGYFDSNINIKVSNVKNKKINLDFGFYKIDFVNCNDVEININKDIKSSRGHKEIYFHKENKNITLKLNKETVDIYSIAVRDINGLKIISQEKNKTLLKLNYINESSSIYLKNINILRIEGNSWSDDVDIFFDNIKHINVINIGSINARYIFTNTNKTAFNKFAKRVNGYDFKNPINLDEEREKRNL